MARTTRVDTHLKVLDERVVARAKARGLDAVVYAPHFTRLPAIRERAARFTDDDLLVVPGREAFAGDWRHRKHVLAVGLSEPVPDFLTLEATLREFDRQDAAVIVPHPEFTTVSLDRGEIEAARDRVDAVEAYNAKLFPTHNARAARLAGELGLPGVGASYAHLRGTVGEAWTAFETGIGSEADLVAALRRAAPRTIHRRGGIGHRLRGLVEFAHLGYENSWAKFDRVVLSGLEPTHPDHLAYDGRFDADAV